MAVFTVTAAPGVELTRQERALQTLQQRYRSRQQQFQQQMNQIAQKAESQSFLTDADRIRKLGTPIDSGAYDLDVLPVELLPAIPMNLPPEELQWRVELRKVEKDYAVDLYKIARDAITQGHPSLAMQLIREVAFRDPDNPSARKLLGFVRDGNTWTTPFARSMQRKGFVDHPQFGWISKASLPRYEKGERYFDGAWVSVAKEEALRADFRNAWEIETEHFEVRTNHSLERGVQIARALEGFHDFFLREYAAFFRSPQQIQRLFDAGAATPGDGTRRHRVYYFRNKEDYIAALEARNPNIAGSTGLYVPNDRTAYFYNDDLALEQSLETMFHEAAHQLLSESALKMFDVGVTKDFWVIEGFACYIESFRPDSTVHRIGDPQHLRINWARQHALVENAVDPMRRFTELSKNQFQQAPDSETLRRRYNQAAGMVHFFLHFQEGIYRDAFISYLSQVYSPVERTRLRAETLEKLTGVPFETLDQQYLEHLRSLPEPIPQQQTPHISSGSSRPPGVP
ncbi:DUF1570 domain-containing protein [Planctomicrobium sp. SH664]|uniref:DUF1570 domain-containing protein n=1 Tax=Planctomicrobium sp. SH664 TaxID=3448125 RepID=UPI003F5C4921